VLCFEPFGLVVLFGLPDKRLVVLVVSKPLVLYASLFLSDLHVKVVLDVILHALDLLFLPILSEFFLLRSSLLDSLHRVIVFIKLVADVDRTPVENLGNVLLQLVLVKLTFRFFSLNFLLVVMMSTLIEFFLVQPMR